MLKCTFSTLGEAWVYILQLITHSGEIIHDDDTRLKEVCDLSLILNDVSVDEIISKYADKKRMELMYKKYSTCGLVGDYKIDYGSYIFKNNGVNQIEWVINRLKNKRDTKSATIGLHKAGENQLSCLSLLDFKIRNGQLKMGAIYRSQNAYASFPGNMLALRKIQADVANELNIPVGAIRLFAFSAHIYEPDWVAVNNLLSDKGLHLQTTF